MNENKKVMSSESGINITCYFGGLCLLCGCSKIFQFFADIYHKDYFEQVRLIL
jgi:hypothetical protein